MSSLLVTAAFLSPSGWADNPEIKAGQALSQPLEMPNPAIIAHRGASYYAPESTLPAYQLARALGADYLELDLQRTKDGHLIALHDNNLKRTTNIESVFPERADDSVSTFTLAELKQLDAGSWFNDAYPDRARAQFVGLKIMTLDEVRQVAEQGNNHPGLYIETKSPNLFPGIEEDLKTYLLAHHWLGDQAPTQPDSSADVNVRFTDSRIILQTFERSSLKALQSAMPDVPKILLLWGGGDYIKMAKHQPKGEHESAADYYSRLKVNSPSDYAQWLEFAHNNGAIGVGPSTIQTPHQSDFARQFSYMDLAMPWMVNMSHQHQLLVHAYTVDHIDDAYNYRNRGVDGFFTNRPAALLQAFDRAPEQTPQAWLEQLGY